MRRIAEDSCADAPRDASALALPCRGDGPAGPAGLPLPPGRMPLLRGGRPLKRWRYVGVYGPELMLCAASGAIGRASARRGGRCGTATTGELARAHAFAPGLVAIGDGRLRRCAAATSTSTSRCSPPARPIEVDEPARRRRTSGRARSPVRARRPRDGRRAHPRDRPRRRSIDDSAGYHARAHRVALVGRASARRPTARAVAWNLVDRRARRAARRASARSGSTASPREVGARRVRRGPRRRAFAATTAASCASPPRPSARARDDLKLFVSDYRQPFGTFSGTLPGGVELAEGYGVMERHDVRW